MSKLVLMLSLICLSILTAGSLLIPNNSIMWLAGSSSGLILLRLIVSAALIVLLITSPPRNLVLRYVIGLFGAGLVLSAAVLTYANHMQFLDSLSLISAGIAMAIVSLEINYEAEPRKARAFAGHGAHLHLQHLLQLAARYAH